MNGDWHKAENAARLTFGDFAEDAAVAAPAPLAPGSRLAAALAFVAAAATGLYLLF